LGLSGVRPRCQLSTPRAACRAGQLPAVRIDHPAGDDPVAGIPGTLAGQVEGPELRHSEGGIARATFRVAVSGRREQQASFLTVVVWRDQAEHAGASLAKGSRVVVVGRLQQRSWTAEYGSVRQAVEVVAEELGPSLTGAP
jgi:single-strand DNA-binding protein